MKNTFSLSHVAVLIVVVAFIALRGMYWTNNKVNGYNATSWDAFGYYMYLPSVFIYEDAKEVNWVSQIDSTYHVTGGTFYQAIALESGTYTNKYLGGVAILELPFFAAGHLVAGWVDAPQDGFSWPYQYAILFGAIFWAALGFIVLRKVLRRYFNEQITAWTILFIGLTSNLIQYVSIDGAMSHAFIFPLYALLLWWTIRWHEQAHWKYAFLIGATIGLATISRPTELIMIFIPILWNTTVKEERKAKWKLVGQHKWQLAVCIIGGIMALLPQLIYWKYTTGSWMYNVGSKWFFLNPWFRVLFGPEKGWFVYTPIAILMVAGFFFMKGRAFKRSVLTFCLLNIWIIISWSDWKYGASYSTRALTHSYPVFALALATVFARIETKKWKWVLPVLLVLLTVLNFYQLSIYNQGILENFSPILGMTP